MYRIAKQQGLAAIAWLPVVMAAITGCSGPDDPDDVPQTLEKLFELCTESEVASAGRYLVYRLDDDKGRRWRDTYDPSKPDELAAIRTACDRIVTYAYENEGHEFGPLTRESESEGVWLVQPVTFEIQGSELEVRFSFLEIDGRYALGDIDY